jgi:hypothetical protein
MTMAPAVWARWVVPQPVAKALNEVEQALVGHQEAFANHADYTQNTKRTRRGQAELFVKWLRGGSELPPRD